MPRWWEWLGRIFWTLLTMGAVGVAVFVLGYALAARFVIPPVVSDFDAQVVEPLLMVLVIAEVVSFASGSPFGTPIRRRCIGGNRLGPD